MAERRAFCSFVVDSSMVVFAEPEKYLTEDEHAILAWYGSRYNVETIRKYENTLFKYLITEQII